MNLKPISSVFINRRFIIVFVALVATGVSVQQYFLGPKYFEEKEYTHYNNYIIFTEAFHHLVLQEDLYSLYPEEHWDYYKYSPTFALFMGPFALLPDWMGLILWNLLNALILVYAVFGLQGLAKDNGWLIWLVLVEMVTSLQNSQSNVLMAGLVIFAFNYQEKRQPALASLMLAFSIYVKLFSLAALSIGILTKQRFRFGLWWLLWMAILGIFPLMVVTPQHLIGQYQAWWQLLQDDHTLSLGLSVMGWLQTWFGVTVDKQMVVLAGAFLYLIPFSMFRWYSAQRFRLLILSSVLIWMVVFNHKAESPTFIIALSGVAIWFLVQSRRWYDIVLFLLVIVFTSLSPTDIFPASLRQNLFEPYVLKAVPCILVWVRVNVEIFRQGGTR
jgi:hypothetical protein